MNISGAQSTEAMINAVSGVENKRVQLQMALLKKTLESQQQQAEELSKLIEGKGQVLDIRV